MYDMIYDHGRWIVRFTRNKRRVRIALRRYPEKDIVVYYAPNGVDIKVQNTSGVLIPKYIMTKATSALKKRRELVMKGDDE